MNELTDDQIKAAIKKYGIDYVRSVYKKLSLNYGSKSEADIVRRDNLLKKIDLGNGSYRYKNIKPE